MAVVAIVGRANVGKSSLFNRLVGERQAITDDAAGTTRDAVYGNVHWGPHEFMLIDTAGLKKPNGELEVNIQEQISQAAELADAIILVTDATIIITDEDRRAAKLALKSGKPVIMAINKIDAATGGLADEFARLGIPTRIEVSAIHGRGTGDLLDAMVPYLPSGGAPETDDVLRIAILGRPNVGKSSLLNTLVGKQQAIVSEIAGTTRDVNIARLKYHSQTIELMDTAGLRRRGKIAPGVEKFSALRTLATIEAADICFVLMDADELSVAGDQHIAGMAAEAGRGLILVVNKWDKIEKDEKTQARITRTLQKDFAFAPWAPLIFISATTGANVTKLFELAVEVYQRRKTQISTPKFNTLLSALTAKQPPAGLKNKRPKINYGTQTSTNPPTFTIFSTYAELVHFSYRRYIENGLRDAYDFVGTPIRLEFRSKRGDK